MKIRTDFVTNSSSSSFIVFSKKELTKETLFELLKLDEEHPLKDIMNLIADCIINCIECENFEDYVKEWYSDYNEEISKEYLELSKKFPYFYEGSFSTEGYDNPMEAALCNMDLNIETDDLVIKHEGGY